MREDCKWLAKGLIFTALVVPFALFYSSVFTCVQGQGKAPDRFLESFNSSSDLLPLPLLMNGEEAALKNFLSQHFLDAHRMLLTQAETSGARLSGSITKCYLLSLCQLIYPFHSFD